MNEPLQIVPTSSQTYKYYPNFVDFTGQRFGKLLVLGPGQRTDKRPRWICQCDCGRQKSIPSVSLRKGYTSCGCVNITHHMTASREYRTWWAMIQRCTNPNTKLYHCYGGRGIKVCERWRHDFSAFYADMGERLGNLTLERIDTDADYTPENVRWATMKEQARNKRTNVLLTFQGRTQSAAAWCEELNLPQERVRGRIRKGWSHEDALTCPVHVKNLQKWRASRNQK